ncbi:E1-E2 ATPase family protein [Mycobacterium xenopi 3993]|nr:E1-E2 ATPase family protein [Mycobacterium xenopi 3993]
MTANALVGGVQRLRAERAAAELFAEQERFTRRVVVPVMATTRRRLDDARHTERMVTVPASSLRPGDIIDLAAPEVVPADARLLVAEDLEVDESLLTGESLPVDKQVEPVAADDPDRASMLFEGSTIVAGTRAPSSSPPGRRPRRNARSPRFPTSNRQPACRRGCGS